MIALRTLIITLTATTLLTSGYAGAHSLPIGDGHISTSPKQGYVYSCQTYFSPNAGGAERTGGWFNAAAGTWDPDLKPIVDGKVKWPGKINISVEGDQRVIRGNGLPVNHTTGNFPVSPSDDAYQYDFNPNSITAGNVLLKLDVNPQLAPEPSCVPMSMIGFALSGVRIFNALDGKGRDAAAHEIQDSCDGHPERSGQYHYHSLSGCLTDSRSGPNDTSDLLGYALDGFGIYGPYENGRKLTTADLDECHGRSSTVMWDGKAVKMYHYVFTEDYPYTIGCFKGDVTGKFTPHSNPPPGRDRPAFGPQVSPNPRRAGDLLQVVAKNLGVSFERLRQIAGAPPPDFNRIAQQLNLPVTTVRAAFQSARQQATGQ